MFLDNCKMQMFLANANFDRKQYARLFQLSTKEMELIAKLRPREILLKTPDYSKILPADHRSEKLSALHHVRSRGRETRESS